MPGNDVPTAVREQYEELPYPLRDPRDEERRLIHTIGSNLVVVNHFCFKGRMDFRTGFRCLVAGGGTGDGLIYLAEQLRDFDAEIIYLDMSVASRRVAEERARVRGLSNITWVTGAIEDMQKLDLGEFDLIHCTGVLHHLESTENGLQDLAAALNEHGSMLLMLYGKYARRPVYDMQALLRAYLPEGIGRREKIEKVRQLIDCLPETNWFRRDLANWGHEISPGGNGDPGLYDLLLHACDQAFDVPGLYALAGSAGLHIQGFPVGSERYNPFSAIQDEAVREQFERMDLPMQQATAELLHCDISRHEFYVGRGTDSVASLDDEDNALLMFWKMYGKHRQLADAMLPGKVFTLQVDHHQIRINCSEILKHLFACMDGQIPLHEMYERVHQALPMASREAIRAELKGIYTVMHERGLLYLVMAGNLATGLPDYDRLNQVPGGDSAGVDPNTLKIDP
ncbi:MAG: class I SAM-dependent methyltransferase [Gammaproteobacteria bacterium]|jgi:2-polyprenyl-3-methyl-5-hydroxy-6-metoxy-1,4-benzoquinol methylase|nr:class I SAM-dependent methyltransferase [Gammaproteobacteria bacterium]